MDPVVGGKVALVTGAGKGVGKAIAQSLAARGAKVAVAGRHRSSLDAVAEEIDGFAAVMDVRDEVAVTGAVQRVAEWGGGIDILVNNAGIGLLSTPLMDTSLERWQDVIETNLTGAFLVTRSAWPYLQAAAGQVLNVSSVAGTQGFSGCSAYCASKFGLNGLSEVLRIEGGAHGVRVLSLCPGAIETEIWGDLASEAEKSRMMQPGQVGEIAATMLATPRNIDLGTWVVLNSRDPFQTG